MAEKQSFMNVTEVAKELGISESHAYKIMRKLNAELKEKGYMTIAGRVNCKFFIINARLFEYLMMLQWLAM